LRPALIRDHWAVRAAIQPYPVTAGTPVHPGAMNAVAEIYNAEGKTAATAAANGCRRLRHV
jgi:hypothetical protein